MLDKRRASITRAAEPVGRVGHDGRRQRPLGDEEVETVDAVGLWSAGERGSSGSSIRIRG
jgi:hypothetical protein